MVSKSSDSSSKSKKFQGEHGSNSLGTLISGLNLLKKQIHANRFLLIGEKVERNKEKLEAHVSKFMELTASRDEFPDMGDNSLGKMLTYRLENPLCKVSGLIQGSGDRDYVACEEVVYSITAKFPYIEKIPPYTTWIFLDRNQRMAEDQSVVGRRRIYYDEHGSEALICSDSEEEIAEPEERKHEFSEAEDHLLWMAFQEYGLSQEVLNILPQFVGGTASEIQERCDLLKRKHQEMRSQSSKILAENRSEGGLCLEKSLSTVMDSFDNIFCRRCLVFDCRLHGCSQVLIDSSEKQSCLSESEDDGKPCSDQCYLMSRVVGDKEAVTLSRGSEGKVSEDELGTWVISDVSEPVNQYDSDRKRKKEEPANITPGNSKLFLDALQISCLKKQKLPDPDSVSLDSEVGSSKNESQGMAADVSGHDIQETMGDDRKEANEEPELKQLSNSKGILVKDLFRSSDWRPLEKELYLKGIEIFGKNSCLIARNLLPGLKTCMEIANYMYDNGAASRGSATVLTNSFPDENKKNDTDHMEQEMPSRSRLLRRRGKTRKLKYSWKSAGHPSIWRRIADGKNQSCRQYNPCGCQFMCGKQCPCLQNGTCCEKYCGCSKSCKNRFRGCHCAKSQCRSRQCPCFAAGRECDPDVCRNCWVSCGDGSMGEPPRQGDGQCGNMRLLLRQQQRILLAKSDVAGWGAFLKKAVNKNDYLGEYTGELISHREADKRGKIYDRANSSFLFDLNDQYVLDAYRKGDKLKFANHSSNPNCYAKVMLVAGDHRVGIFAKEQIDAGEELFYDYRYGPDQAPVWARKPEGSKRDDSPMPQDRAKKHQ